ncbi:MAG: methyltransferase domain-containing protein [Archaeoglobaceae archaeon]|nr:methyltransferase domain-containing protein [Archaeoglobaceae archaeon]MCX8152496.1 methyltransferase domain-containing protein [Archaeoglobaceae archaeon]MDW8013689.1 methyltransferase domain-containing protein [Archaeoglobaceae archaeon]
MKATKLEVIGVVFAKIMPRKDDTFADIGCGSGAVSEFFAPYVKKVYAVDIDEKAVFETKKKLENYNAEVFLMDGLEFLKNYDYSIVFFGGTKKIEDMLEVAVKKARKIVANAARIEVAVKIFNKMKSSGLKSEILVVNIWKSYELAGGTAFKPLNPVFVVVGCSSE